MPKSVRKCEFCDVRARVKGVRERDGLILRRLVCGKGHAFTTVELRPKTGTKRVLTTRLRELTQEV